MCSAFMGIGEKTADSVARQPLTDCGFHYQTTDSADKNCLGKQNKKVSVDVNASHWRKKQTDSTEDGTSST